MVNDSNNTIEHDIVGKSKMMLAVFLILTFSNRSVEIVFC